MPYPTVRMFTLKIKLYVGRQRGKKWGFRGRERRMKKRKTVKRRTETGRLISSL